MKPEYLVEARSMQGKATEDLSNPLETGPFSPPAVHQRICRLLLILLVKDNDTLLKSSLASP